MLVFYFRSYYSFPVVGGRASMLRKLESEEYAGTLLESVRGMEVSAVARAGRRWVKRHHACMHAM